MTTRFHPTIGRVRATKPHAAGATAVGRHASLRSPVDDAPTSAIRDASLSTVWIDRDLSWLEFNRRVLAEALDERTPLLERVKFLAIFSSNLDEFFMKRMAVLREDASPERQQLLGQIRERLEPMVRQQAEHFLHRIIPELSRHRIHLRRWSDLTEGQRLAVSDYFDAQVSPALTPLIIHPTQPFPFFSNLSLSLGIRPPRRPDGRDARCPDQGAARVAAVGEGPGRRRCGRARVRSTARSDSRERPKALSRHAPDVTHAVPADPRRGSGDQRGRGPGAARAGTGAGPPAAVQPAVRLEFAANADERMRQMLCHRFNLAAQDVYELAGELDYTSLFQIAALDSRELRDLRGRRSPPTAWTRTTTFSTQSATAISSSITRTTVSTRASSGSSATAAETRTRSRSR